MPFLLSYQRKSFVMEEKIGLNLKIYLIKAFNSNEISDG
jgi:hypothetical protein